MEGDPFPWHQPQACVVECFRQLVTFNKMSLRELDLVITDGWLPTEFLRDCAFTAVKANISQLQISVKRPISSYSYVPQGQQRGQGGAGRRPT